MKVRTAKEGLERGQISYDDLDSESKIDLAYAIGYKTGEVREESDEEGLAEVKIGLENGPAILPIVMVDPSLLLKASFRRSISKVAARKYAAEMVAGACFPPVVIDSDRRSDVLREGGHRTLAATMAKIQEIPAIDIAGTRVVFIGEGRERLITYDFKRKRIK